MISSCVLALVDERRELAAHLVRRPARILAALADVGVAAGAAGADDLVLQLLLELGARVERGLRVLRRRSCPAAPKRRRRRRASASSSVSAVVRRRFGRQLAPARTSTSRSGSSAMPVPNARMPKPSQIQLTSGLTMICRRRRLRRRASIAAEHDVEILGERPADRHLGRRLLSRACGRTTCAGYSVSICLPSSNTAMYAVDHLLLAVVGDLHAVVAERVAADRASLRRASAAPARRCLKPLPAKPRKISTMPRWTM